MKSKRLIFPALLAVIPLLAMLLRERIGPCLAAFGRYLRGFPLEAQALPLPPPSRGNSVRLLVDGDEILPAIRSLINGGDRSVRYQVMLFRPDEAGRKVAASLASAARRGVQVQLSFDVGQSVDGPLYRRYPRRERRQNAIAMRGLLEELGRAGVALRENSPEVRSDQRPLSPAAAALRRELRQATCAGANHVDHRKVLIVDGRRAVVGGVNVGVEYLYNIPADLGVRMDLEAERRRKDGLAEAWQKWLDVAAVVSGPAVSELAREFDLRWELLGGEPIGLIGAPPSVGKALIQVLSQRPGDGQIAARQIQLIRAAGRSIFIAAPYVSYRPGLEELMWAARRAVEVVFLFPGEMNDVPISRRIFRSFTQELMAAGVRVVEHNRRMIHAKIMVVDGRWTSVGSFNFNYRSFKHDFEQNLVIDDPAFARRVTERVFERVMAVSAQLKEPYQKRLNLLDRIALPFT